MLSFENDESAGTRGWPLTARPWRGRLWGAGAATLVLAGCANETVQLPQPASDGPAPADEGPSHPNDVNTDGAGAKECAPGRFARKTVLLSEVQFANAISGE